MLRVAQQPRARHSTHVLRLLLVLVLLLCLCLFSLHLLVLGLLLRNVAYDNVLLLGLLGLLGVDTVVSSPYTPFGIPDPSKIRFCSDFEDGRESRTYVGRT